MKHLSMVNATADKLARLITEDKVPKDMIRNALRDFGHGCRAEGYAARIQESGKFTAFKEARMLKVINEELDKLDDIIHQNKEK